MKQLVNVLFKVGYPLKSEEHDEIKGSTENGSKKFEENDEQETKEKSAISGREKSKTEKEREEDAKKEKEFAGLMDNFKMEGDVEKDTQPFVALQAGWESSVGEITIYGKITKDFGTRFENFPVRITLLTRYQSPQASKVHCTTSPLTKSNSYLRKLIMSPLAIQTSIFKQRS